MRRELKDNVPPSDDNFEYVLQHRTAVVKRPMKMVAYEGSFVSHGLDVGIGKGSRPTIYVNTPSQRRKFTRAGWVDVTDAFKAKYRKPALSEAEALDLAAPVAGPASVPSAQHKDDPVDVAPPHNVLDAALDEMEEAPKRRGRPRKEA